MAVVLEVPPQALLVLTMSLASSVLLVMELVDGCPLRWVLRLCRRSRVYLPLELVGYIVSRVADGLHFAHEARDEEGTPMEIVHRDICPTNILLSRVGAVKVIDFGVAKSSTQLHQTALRVVG